MITGSTRRRKLNYFKFVIALAVLAAFAAPALAQPTTCGSIATDSSLAPTKRSASIGMSDSSGGTPDPPKSGASTPNTRLIINPDVSCTWEDTGTKIESVDDFLGCISTAIALPQNGDFYYRRNGTGDQLAYEISKVVASEYQIIPGIEVSEEDPGLTTIEILAEECTVVDENEECDGQPGLLDLTVPKFLETPNAEAGFVRMILGGIEIDAQDNIVMHHQTVSVNTSNGANMTAALKSALIGAGFAVSQDTVGLHISDMPNPGGGADLPITCAQLTVDHPSMPTTKLMFQLRTPPGGGLGGPGGGGGGGR